MKGHDAKTYMSIRLKMALSIAVSAIFAVAAFFGLIQMRFALGEGFQPLRTLGLYLLAVIVFLLFMMFLVELYFTRELLEAIRKLKFATERIASGDLDYRIELNTRDEIDELGVFFNKMAAQLQSSQEALRNYIKEKDSVNADLLKMTEDLSRANAELNVYRQEMEERVNERTKDLSQTQLTISKMLDDLKESEEKLEKSNIQLVKAYEKLKNTQNSLIQAEKMAALGRFSAGIAHEVKNPLAITLGGLEYLEYKIGKSDPDKQEAIQKSKEAVLRADTILKDLMHFASPSKLELEYVSPEALVDEIAALFKYKAPLKINIQLDLKKENAYILADKNQIQQVILNLLLNSCEAMSHGGDIAIKTYVAAIDNSVFGKNPVCVIEICDNGEGIPNEILSKIFEPFFTTKRDGKGTGMGLAIAKTIIDNHKGDLTFQSEAGKGTVARIILPLVDKK